MRHIIKSNKLDFSKIKGTGRDGRILKEDVLRFMGKLSEVAKAPKELPESFISNVLKPATATATTEIKTEKKIPQKKGDIPVKSADNTGSNDKTIKITGFKKAMTKSMTQANLIPSFLCSDEYNVDKLIRLREESNILYDKQLKFSYLPFFIKAVSLALNDFPELNSVVNPETDNGYIYEYTIKSQHNISIAIDGPEGLVVPNIKNVAFKSVSQIQQNINELKDKAFKKTLTNSDFTDGTFTISSVGNIGGKQLGPVIMPPQTCIIGISKIFDAVKVINKNEKPQYKAKGSNILDFKENENQSVVFHKAINLCLTADHRVLDGAYVVRFTEKLRTYVENPMKILI